MKTIININFYIWRKRNKILTPNPSHWTIVCPKISIFNFKKNAPLKELQLKNTYSFFTCKSSQERKQISLGRFWWEMLTSFLILKSLGILHIIFQRYHPGTFMPIAMQNSHSCFICSHVLKSDKLVRAFQERNLGLISYYWMNIIWTLGYLKLWNNLRKCVA